MDFVHMIELAQGAIPVVVDIATRLGIENENPIFGRLGAELCILTLALEHPSSPDQEETFRRRIAKLLCEIENLCTWPRRIAKNEYPTLRALTDVQSSPSFREAGSRVRSGIEAFASAHHLLVKKVFSLLSHFPRSKGSQQSDKSSEVASSSMKVQVDLPTEYPKYVNELCYSVLRKYLMCTCIGTESCQNVAKQHLIRLRLNASHEVTDDGTVRFEMLFSTSPAPFSPANVVHWQDLQLLAPSKAPERKQVHFDRAEKLPAPGRETFRRVRLGEFCQLIRSRNGSRLCIEIHGKELRALSHGEPIGQNVLNAPSISLKIVLETYHLSPKMKVAMAYIIARSIWRFYDSDWMNPVWSRESIHFMQEPLLNGEATTALYACKPYFSVQFMDGASKDGELSDVDGEIHRYPRVLALGILLIEISLGYSFQKNCSPQNPNINANWLAARDVSENNKAWSSFDYSTYRTAVQNCLDRGIFDTAAFIQGQTAEQYKRGLEDRRAILYERIVYHLELLVKGTGWSEHLAMIEPMNPRSTQPGEETASSDLMSRDQKNSELERFRQPSATWLQNVTKINKYIARLSDIPTTPVKIAVLDTGCDHEAVFFHSPARSSRIKGWKDWVNNSADFEDCSGHGTHAVGLAMKIAPAADIFIARVAKHRQGLQGASEVIARAIDWAVTQWNVDIVSMSFGFPKEMPAISRAIRKAVLDRDDAILFFAAAANHGANEEEMFPANHESVISIRGTNSQGTFSDFNPPRGPDENVVYGTLGTDVPSAWLHDHPGEMHKSGTSVATPIAAGIAAVVLGYIGGKPPGSVDKLHEKRLRSRRGMLAIFKTMAKDMGNGCSFLNPWNFFREDDSVCLSKIVAAVSRLPR